MVTGRKAHGQGEQTIQGLVSRCEGFRSRLITGQQQERGATFGDVDMPADAGRPTMAAHKVAHSDAGL